MSNTKNYVGIKNMFPWRNCYMYLDLPEYLADKIFIDKKIRVNFKREYEKPGEKYIVTMCTVARGNNDKFLEAMDELKRKMLLTGHGDYEKACENFQSIFEE